MKPPISLTFAQTRAWHVLQALPGDDLLFRPVEALAAAMQIGVRSARRHVSVIRKAQLVTPYGPHGFIPIVPREGSSISGDEDLDAAYRHVTRAPWRDVIPADPPPSRRPIGFIVPPVDPVVLPHQQVAPSVKIDLSCTTSAPVVPVTPAPHPGVVPGTRAHCPGPAAMGRSETQISGEKVPGICLVPVQEQDQKDLPRTELVVVKARVRKVQVAITRSSGGGPLRKETVEGTILGRMYEARRRKIDPEYQMGAGDAAKMRIAAKSLAVRKVGQKLWDRYLDYVFEVFPQHARCEYPPALQIAHETWIDHFVATLGERPRDYEQVYQRLVKEIGFQGDRADACIATLLVEKHRRGAKLPRDLDEEPGWAAAVYWVRDHIDEIDFNDDPDSAGGR